MSARRIEVNQEDGTLAYFLDFENIRDSRKLYGYGDRDHNFFLIRGVVKCEFKGADKVEKGYGYAWCFKSDPWDERKGERIALKRALSPYKDRLQREARRMIWEQYLKQRPIKAKPKPDRKARKQKVEAVVERLIPEPVFNINIYTTKEST